MPGALVCVLLLLTYAPWRFSLPGAGIEESWHEVITYGAAAGWQWGRDIVYTYGPLGSALPNLWSDELWVRDLVVNALLVVALAVGAAGLPRAGAPFPALALAFVVVLPIALASRFGVYSALPLLAALGHFARPPGPLRLDIAMLAIAAGLYALVYIASGIPALATFLLIDASRVRHRRIPVAVPLFAASAFGAWLAAGQSLATLGMFLRATFEQVSGYAESVALAGPRWEIAAFLGASLLGAWLVAKADSAPLRDPARRGDALLLHAALFVFWFVAFKRGFVRHDLHSVSAWFALAIVAAGHVSARWSAIASARVRQALVALSLAATATGILVSAQAMLPSAIPLSLERVFLQRPWTALRQAAHAALDPARWRAEWREAASNARAQLRATTPVPRVDGTVDILPYLQSSLLAHGADYRPRPVFHDYAAVTPWLVERNLAHYRSADAARYVLFRPDTIDNRYPLLDQGPAWLDLLQRYDPLRIDGGFLVFERRATPLTAVEGNVRSFAVVPGEWVTLGGSDAPLILRASVEFNLGGKLLGLALRPPILKLGVRLANGAEREFRLVPVMARQGFLLSPLVESSIALAALATNAPPIGAGNAVVAFRIDTQSEAGRHFVETPIRVEVSSWTLQAGSRGTPELRRIVARGGLAAEMVAHVATPSSRVEARGTEVFAHAPSSLALPVASARRVRASFGIHDGAFTGAGTTDGVCFRVAAAEHAGARSVLFERCLDPLARAADRAVQSIDLAVDMPSRGTLVFETDCRATCDWDWSFWRDVEVDP